MTGNRLPAITYSTPDGIQYDGFINDITENAGTLVRAEGYEIRAESCVIIFRQANTAAVMGIQWFRHGVEFYSRMAYRYTLPDCIVSNFNYPITQGRGMPRPYSGRIETQRLYEQDG